MNEVLFDKNSDLIKRVNAQIDFEVTGDVEVLYHYILPSIREDREQKRNDEPALTLSAIDDFVSKVKSSKCESVEINKFYPNAELYDGNPAAEVILKVSYNDDVKPKIFRTVWVLDKGIWYSTALNKSWF